MEYNGKFDIRWLAGTSHLIKLLSQKIDSFIEIEEIDSLDNLIDDIATFEKEKITENPFSTLYRPINNNEKIILYRFYLSHLYYRLKYLNRSHEYYGNYLDTVEKVKNLIDTCTEAGKNEFTELSEACFESFKSIGNHELLWSEYSFFFFGSRPYIPFNEFGKYMIFTKNSNNIKYAKRLLNIEPLLIRNKDTIINQSYFNETDKEVSSIMEFLPEFIPRLYNFDEIKKIEFNDTIATNSFENAEPNLNDYNNQRNAYITLDINTAKLRLLYRGLFENGFIDADFNAFSNLFKNQSKVPIKWLQSASVLGKFMTLIFKLKNNTGKKVFKVTPFTQKYKDVFAEYFIDSKGKSFDVHKLKSVAGGGKSYKTQYPLLRKITQNLISD
jgi:hypothetical protein